MGNMSVEREAVKIAAVFLQKYGMCKYPSIIKCRHLIVNEEMCQKCIEKFLLAKARKKIGKEQMK